MNLKRHMGLVISGSIGLVLAIVIGVMLFRFQSSYQQVRTDLRNTVARLNSLYGRDPFPSEENVSLVQSNLVVLDKYAKDLFTLVKMGQVDVVQMEPAGFPLLLDGTIRRLHKQAGDNQVKLPSRFSFGFERYALGALPNQEDVPRLVLQVKTIEKLCEIVFKSKISEMENIQRTVFERGVLETTDASAFSRRRGPEASPESTPEQSVAEWVDPSGLFSRENYTLTLRASDSAVWGLLNELARSGLFIVVSKVELINDTPIVKVTPAERPAAAIAAAPATAGRPADQSGAFAAMFGTAGAVPGAAPEQPAGPKPREERIVAGLEMVKAIVEVRVYRFVGGAGEESQP